MAIALANKTSGNITLPDNSTVTVDWSGAFTPSAGSTIVLVISSLSNSATAVEVTPASGWSTAAMTNSGALDCWVLYKPNVTTSDTSVVLTVNDIAAAQNGVYSVYELTGARTSGSIDSAGTSEDENYVASANTTIQCGTTSTLTYGAGIALAVAAIDSAANWSSGAWSSGWTNEITIDRSTSTGHRVASKSFSATTALSASFGSITSDECYGAIVAIYEATTGGTGTLSKTLGAATLSATGEVDIAGALSKTLAAATVLATGEIALAGALSKSLDAATLVSAGTIGATGVGSLSQTLGAVTLVGTGTLSIAGQSAITLGAATLASTGEIKLSGALARTLADLTLSGSGSLAGALTGALSQTLGAATLIASGALTISGSLSKTLGTITLVASDTSYTPAAARTLAIGAEMRRLDIAAESRRCTIPPETRTWSPT
jgi:hypothetical protein